jgi:hypothetical protein
MRAKRNSATTRPGLGIVFDLAHPLLYALMFIAGDGMAGFTASSRGLINGVSSVQRSHHGRALRDGLLTSGSRSVRSSTSNGHPLALG